jgi:hypothetical protein
MAAAVALRSPGIKGGPAPRPSFFESPDAQALSAMSSRSWCRRPETWTMLCVLQSHETRRPGRQDHMGSAGTRRTRVAQHATGQALQPATTSPVNVLTATTASRLEPPRQKHGRTPANKTRPWESCRGSRVHVPQSSAHNGRANPGLCRRPPGSHRRMARGLLWGQAAAALPCFPAQCLCGSHAETRNYWRPTGWLKGPGMPESLRVPSPTSPRPARSGAANPRPSA